MCKAEVEFKVEETLFFFAKLMPYFHYLETSFHGATV